MISLLRRKEVKISKVFGLIPIPENNKFTIRVKNISFRINTNHLELDQYIKSTYSDFITDEIPEYIFNFFRNKERIKLDKSEDDSFSYSYIQFYSTFFYYRYSKIINQVDVILPRRFEFWEFENFLKIFISSISLKYNSILIHASAIIKNDKVVLFSGQSGAGKSTIANLSGYEIIHDDNILITYLGNKIFQLEAIPFKTPYKKKIFVGEIEGFYRVFQNHETYVKEIDLNKQLSHLLFGLWAFDHFGNKNSRKYNMDIIKYCTDMLLELKVKELYFTKTKDFIELI